MRYAARRVAQGALLLFAVSVVSFVFGELAPGDYFAEMQLERPASAATVAAIRAEHGLDRPLAARYLAWAASVARGEFGWSLAYQSAVGPLLARRIPATLLLTGAATLIAWMIAIPLGIWNAAKRGGWLDSSIRLLLSVLLAIPDLLLAVILLVWAVRTGRLPAGGMHTPGSESPADTMRHMVVPVAVLVLGMLPVLVRHVRAAVGEAMESPFTLAARAHGIPQRRVLFRQVLPAAMNPLITLFGFSLGTLLSASLLVEVLVGWPGLGPLFLEAIFARDFALVLGVVMASASLLVGGHLIADLLLYRADPRIRVP